MLLGRKKSLKVYRGSLIQLSATWTLGYNDFNNLILPDRWWMQNEILRPIHKKFLPFSAAFDFKVINKC